MRFIYGVFLIIVLTAFAGLAQKRIILPVQKEPTIKSYSMGGSILMQKQYKDAADYIKAHPDYISKMKLRKTTTWNFTVGSTKSWWAYNYSAGSYYQVASTCRGIGNNCYVFVENTSWTSGKVNQAVVDSVINDFDNKTPSNPNKGIYQTDVDTFGNPPNVDGDPRIIIEILDIKDGYNGTGGWVAGYFDPTNEIDQMQSNIAEIYYMDCSPTALTTSDGLEVALETCAHEFQHMINWNYHQTNPELTFINEGLSMFAEVNCGYPPSFQSLYAGEPNHYLFDWRGSNSTLVLNDYGRAQRFFMYWADQFGTGIFKNIVQDNLIGLSGLEHVLSSTNQTLNFTQLFENWEVANKLNNNSVNPAYGYTYPNLPSSYGKTFYLPGVSETDTVKPLAAEYYTFTGGSNLNITFSAPSSSIAVKAIELGSSTQVVDVPLNSPFSIPDYGSKYSTIHFAVIGTSQTTSQIYSFTASSIVNLTTTELKYDNTEPTGYYLLTPGDTICVVFDAVQGGTLDSIRVALRRAGTMIGGVWQFSGNSNPTPFGARLAVPISVSTKDSTTVPYPVPYQNWSTVDLRPYSIQTDQPFAVGFVVGASPSAPGIMATDYPGQNYFHSLTYLQSADGSTPGWYYLASSDTTVAIYLIRAYISFVTGVKQEITLAPKEFSLSQNYPNPFNPSTKIDFTLPKAERVKVIVYNQLGQQIMQIADRDYAAGNHSIYFNGANLASGIYFYKILAGDFTQTKKMILMK